MSGKGKLSVTKDGKPVSTLTAKNIILATGARARELPGMEPDGKLIWYYKDALVPKDVPERLLVIGSGAIGIEFANFFHTFGAKTTVVEMMDRIVPAEDAEVSAFLQKSLVKDGMEIMTSVGVKSLKKVSLPSQQHWKST